MVNKIFPPAIDIRIVDPSSEFYHGPKTDSPYVLFVLDKKTNQGVVVEFDNEDAFSSALVRAGVSLYKVLHPEYKGPHLIPGAEKGPGFSAPETPPEVA